MERYDIKLQLVYLWLEQSLPRSSAQKIAQAKVKGKLSWGKIHESNELCILEEGNEGSANSRWPKNPHLEYFASCQYVCVLYM